MCKNTFYIRNKAPQKKTQRDNRIHQRGIWQRLNNFSVGAKDITSIQLNSAFCLCGQISAERAKHSCSSLFVCLFVCFSPAFSVHVAPPRLPLFCTNTLSLTHSLIRSSPPKIPASKLLYNLAQVLHRCWNLFLSLSSSQILLLCFHQPYIISHCCLIPLPEYFSVK